MKNIRSYLIAGALFAITVIVVIWAIKYHKDHTDGVILLEKEKEALRSFHYQYVPLCAEKRIEFGCALDFSKAERSDAADLLSRCVTEFKEQVAALVEPTEIHFYVVPINEPPNTADIPFWSGFNFKCRHYEPQSQYTEIKKKFADELDKIKRSTPEFEQYIDDDCRPKIASGLGAASIGLSKTLAPCDKAKAVLRDAIIGNDGHEGFVKVYERQQAALADAWENYLAVIRKPNEATTDLAYEISQTVGGQTPSEQYCVSQSLQRLTQLFGSEENAIRFITIIATLHGTCKNKTNFMLADKDEIILYEITTNDSLAPDKLNAPFTENFGGKLIKHGQIPQWQLPPLAPPPAKYATCGAGLRAGCLVDFSLSHNMEIAGLINACAEQLEQKGADYRYSSMALFILPIGYFPIISAEDAPTIATWRFDCPEPPTELVKEYAALAKLRDQLTAQVVKTQKQNEQKLKSEVYGQIMAYNARIAGWQNKLAIWQIVLNGQWNTFWQQLRDFRETDTAQTLKANLEGQFPGIGAHTCLTTAFWQAGQTFTKQNPSIAAIDRKLLVFSDMQEECAEAEKTDPRLLFSSLRGTAISFYHFAPKGASMLVPIDKRWIEIFDSLQITYEPAFTNLPKRKK